MYFFFNSSMWISNLRSVNLFSTLHNVYNKLLHSWRISLCKVYTVLQIKYLQPICRRYLQRSNYLSISALHAFRCRWQMFLCFFNFIVWGLHVKIMPTTVSHKPNSPLCPPCPLWWKHELNTPSFYSPPHPISLLYRKSGDIVFNNVSPL